MKTKLLIFLILFAKISHSQYLFSLSELIELSIKKQSDFTNFVISKGYSHKHMKYGQLTFSDSLSNSISTTIINNKIQNTIYFNGRDMSYFDNISNELQNDSNGWKYDSTYYGPVQKATKNSTVVLDMGQRKKYIKGKYYVLLIKYDLYFSINVGVR